MLVELFALSGAGKTTVTRVVADQANVATRKDLTAAWAAGSVLERLLHLGRALASAGRVMAAVRFGAGTRVATREGGFRLLRLLFKAEWLRSRSGVVLLDQGMLQEIWSILLSSGSARVDRSLLVGLIRALYQGIDATIVVLELDPEIASQRISAREHGRSRFDQLDDEQRRTSLAAASGLQQLIVDAARLADLSVVTIDATLPAEVVAERLRGLLPAPQAGKDRPTSARPRRVSIVGASGSGKTFLARQLALRLSVPLSELDQIRDAAAAEEPPAPSFSRRVADVVEEDEWIVDGHYRDVRHLIWSRADMVVWLNYPLHVVALRLIRRFRHKSGLRGTSPDRPAGPPTTGQEGAEASTWTRRFGRLARTLRERRAYRRLLRSRAYRHARIIELRSIEATQQWLHDL